MKKIFFHIIKATLNISFKIYPQLGLNIAYYLFTRPLFQIQRQDEINFLNKIESSWFEFEGEKIKVYQYGHGSKKILFIHGWGGYAGNFYELMSAFSSEEFTIFAFDAPAHHASSGRKTDVFQIIRLSKYLIKNCQPNFIIGHSMGSAVAVSALADMSDISLNRIVLLSCPNNFEYLVESFGKNFSLDELHLESFKKTVQSKLKKSFEDSKIETIIKKVNVKKILLIHDKYDRVLPFDNALQIKNAVNGVLKFQPIENIGHYKMLKDRQVIQSVKDFILNEN